jgi:quercetin dioxygenase-like cupin family protein
VRGVGLLTNRSLILSACALLAVGAGIGWAAAKSGGPPAVKRIALAATDDPHGADGRTLGLSRVVIPPGGQIALHHHQGTQIARVESGVLTYSVETGSVEVRRGAADDDPQVVRTIEAGESGRIRAGEWLVEQPSDHHRAANRGDKRIVIYLATLLETGAPPSTPG